MGSVRQTPIQITVRTAHLTVDLTVYTYNTQHWARNQDFTGEARTLRGCTFFSKKL